MAYSWDAKRKTAETNGLFAAHTNNYNGSDDEDRLTNWQRGSGDTQAWDLSKVGDWNRTVVNGVSEERTHNAVHEIEAATPLTPNPAAQLLHDAKGNLTHNKNGHDWEPVEEGLGSRCEQLSCWTRKTEGRRIRQRRRPQSDDVQGESCRDTSGGPIFRSDRALVLCQS